jgi:uncharacterized surface protein with fasciclin (FAS1) repeats
MIKKYFALSVIAASVAVAGCSSDDNTPAEVAFVATPGVGGTAYDFIVSSDDHTTLEAAIDAAGLADTLDNPANSYTIFAPNDLAFVALDSDGDETTLTTAELIEPANREDLVRILQYHVLGSDLTAAAISQLITDAGGDPAVRDTLLVDAGVAQTVAFTLSTTANEGVAINGADIDSVNNLPAGQTETQGRVHVISSLLTPPAAAVIPPVVVVPPVVVGTGAVDATLAASGTLEIFRTAITTDFSENLDRDPWTVFVPNDTILGAAGISVMTTLQVQNHIVAAEPSDPAALAAMTTIQASSNASYAVAVTDGVTTVGGFAVELIGTGAGGAQIYSIAGVLTP